MDLVTGVTPDPFLLANIQKKEDGFGISIITLECRDQNFDHESR